MFSILINLPTLLIFSICITAIDQDEDPNLVAKMKTASMWLNIATPLPNRH
jgi:hypothetical protein